jgi:hypothetical protein
MKKRQEKEGWLMQWYFAMKLQWLWRMQCHITASLILQADAWTALALHALD